MNHIYNCFCPTSVQLSISKSTLLKVFWLRQSTALSAQICQDFLNYQHISMAVNYHGASPAWEVAEEKILPKCHRELSLPLNDIIGRNTAE
jgi:hypothetical protein